MNELLNMRGHVFLGTHLQSELEMMLSIRIRCHHTLFRIDELNPRFPHKKSGLADTKFDIFSPQFY